MEDFRELLKIKGCNDLIEELNKLSERIFTTEEGLNLFESTYSERIGLVSRKEQREKYSKEMKTKLDDFKQAIDKIPEFLKDKNKENFYSYAEKLVTMLEDCNNKLKDIKSLGLEMKKSSLYRRFSKTEGNSNLKKLESEMGELCTEINQEWIGEYFGLTLIKREIENLNREIGNRKGLKGNDLYNIEERLRKLLDDLNHSKELIHRLSKIIAIDGLNIGFI